MIPAAFARGLAKVHKWLAIGVGVQLMLWIVSGLFFTIVPLSDVRGEGLYAAQPAQVVDLSRVTLTPADAARAVAEDAPGRILLRQFLDQPVYEVATEAGVYLVSAETGARLSPLDEAQVRAIATAVWKGGGEIETVEFIEASPREAGKPRRVWKVGFSGAGERVLYVDASTGAPGPARTETWRLYDFLWSLHIMDYGARENFNHPLVIAAAALAAVLWLSGLGLLVHRLGRMIGKAWRRPG